MERGPVAGPLPFPTDGGTTVTRVSELHRRFDGQPTRGSDVFTPGMWQGGCTKVSVTPESSAQIHLDHTRNRGVRDFLARLSRQFLPAQVAKGVGAPPMVQCMPDCLSRWPMTVVQPTGLRSRTAAAT